MHIIKLSFPKLNAAHRIHFLAWQRSTLAERKLATIVAKNLSCLVTIACFFPLLRLSLTHLALLNSLRSFLVSSDSNVFTSPSHFSLCFLFYFDILDIKKETLRSQLAWQRSTLAERKLATIVAKNLSCLVTIACFFPLLRLSLTHLALLNSLRSFLVSSDSNVFTSPSHFSLC